MSLFFCVKGEDVEDADKLQRFIGRYEQIKQYYTTFIERSLKIFGCQLFNEDGKQLTAEMLTNAHFLANDAVFDIRVIPKVPFQKINITLVAEEE